jgi:hypothetical protein
MHGPSVIPERRRVQRRPARERATLIADDGVFRGCLIMDFSQHGARLGLGAPNPLPNRFRLMLPTGRRVKAVLIWQRGLVAGVAFDMPLGIIDRLTLWNRLRRSSSDDSVDYA